jgi:hypothetical protein
MKINQLLFLTLCVQISGATAEEKTTSSTILKQYKNFLECGTYVGDDWVNGKPKSRYETFKRAFELFEERGGKVIVELGTTRSFVHGGLPGCNSDDIRWWTPNNPENWDWGAGCFTRTAAACLRHLKPQIHTVDIAADHIERCKTITKDFADIITYHVNSSLTFLQKCQFPGGIDLIYLDTGDMTPIEPTALLQLQEAKIIVQRNLLLSGGLILIDDVRNQTPKKFGETSDLGKAKYSIAYLLNNGFEIIEDEYQVLLRKR